MMLILAVATSLRFLPQLSQLAYQSLPRRIAQIRGGMAADDIAALIQQLRDADAALQALEREQDNSARALATISTLESSVKMGVAALREAGMPDDQIFASVMAPNVASSPPPAAPPPPAAAIPISDRPLCKGETNGVVLIRDADGSIAPYALLHRLQITEPSTGEGEAVCVCRLNAPESHAPGAFCIKACVDSIREVTQAMFVHVEESEVLGMLHDATNGACGAAATKPPAINLPSYFKR